MKTADELFDGSDAHLIGDDTTADKVKRLADEYAIALAGDETMRVNTVPFKRAELHAAIDEAIAAEKEQCAKVCEEMESRSCLELFKRGCVACACEIRGGA